MGLDAGAAKAESIPTTTENIKRVVFMPATLRLTAAGVNAVGGGGEARGVSG
jgi:hypothetical protein